jgi:hypothetical protein
MPSRRPAILRRFVQRKTLTLCCALVGVLALLPSEQAHARPPGKLLPERGALFGAYSNPGGRWSGDMTGRGEVREVEEALGRKLDIVHTYYDWDDRFPTLLERWALAGGRIPLASWSGIKLDRILNGSQDALIRARARGVKRLFRPIFIRWGWEMNGSWFPWSGPANGNDPSAYVAAWRRIHRIFRDEGARNAVWVWCPNGDDNPQESWNHWASYYPGDRYVDWVGVDLYNWGTRRSWSSWTSFSSLVRPLYADYARRKPIMIAETGSVEDGGSKAAWISEARASIKRAFPSVGAFVWFHIDDDEDWRANSSAASFAAFQRMAKDPYFNRRLRRKRR